MQDIKAYNTFIKIEPVNKGWSSDKKYYIETVDGRRLLLRVADISECDRKKAEFEIVGQVADLGVPMSLPVDFGNCDNGKSVYSLLTWCDSEDMETIISSNTLSSIYWAISFGENEVTTKKKQARDVLSWFDNMNNPVPAWYLENFYVQYIDNILN